jgi:hypothetical protein
MHHAQGVLCGVTLPMHLAAAVETRKGMPKNRPCVVIAGGREPMQWEAYPHHQFIHANGALRCCDIGGCWKSRTVPLGDGDKKDESLCLDVVNLETLERKRGKEWGTELQKEPKKNATQRFLPRCMDMVSSEEVIRRIECYFDGGIVSYLSEKEAHVAEGAVKGRDNKLVPVIA